jgi:hypothetical protein
MPPTPELIMAAALILGPTTSSHQPTPAPSSNTPAVRELHVPLAELRTVLDVAGNKLEELIQRREKFGALALYEDQQGASLVEWHTLRVFGINDVGLRDNDRQLGITRRYLCKIRAMHHRVQPAGEPTWSAWREGSHPAFPTFVEVICEQGRWHAVINDHTGFRPPR